MLTTWPLLASHTRAVRSSLAVAISRPSGLKATAFTAPPWPRNVSCCWPLITSHTIAVPSWLAVAKRVPIRAENHCQHPARNGQSV